MDPMKIGKQLFYMKFMMWLDYASKNFPFPSCGKRKREEESLQLILTFLFIVSKFVEWNPKTISRKVKIAGLSETLCHLHKIWWEFQIPPTIIYSLELESTHSTIADRHLMMLL